ncbi:hypothetical protein THAOC_03072 [Thalassiosira oceanica]|uniref:HMG box domain-containing protein n=1 Tax=Thalassiosira oceanica TaxID=159749 RepID=K0T953_THAOC|nr:hypothetical protein THAOC_03072 [Thalassiosira oceanica]|eukprot:EJK75208.1 hypothetical protein THAOC_03072 [Thalassiosira oceanica]
MVRAGGAMQASKRCGKPHKIGDREDGYDSAVKINETHVESTRHAIANSDQETGMTIDDVQNTYGKEEVEANAFMHSGRARKLKQTNDGILRPSSPLDDSARVTMSSQSSKCGAMSSAKTKRHKTVKTEMQRSVEALDPRRNLPLNRYNLYCILERQRLVQSNPDYRPSENERKLPSDIYTGYEGLQLPKMPPRYQDLVVAEDWFVPGKRKLVKRPHRKVHGMFSLKEISRLTADTWKTIDKETLDYLTAVAQLILERYKQIETDLGGPLAKKSRPKTNRKTSLPEQPPKASTSTSLSADTYYSLLSPPTNSKGDKDVCLEPLNLHDVDDFWESAAACPQASLSQGTSAVGHQQQSVISGLQPFMGGLEVGKMEPAEIGRLCLPNISDLETNWKNAAACPQAQPRPSRRASVGHTAPVSHAAAMSHQKPLRGFDGRKHKAEGIPASQPAQPFRP